MQMTIMHDKLLARAKDAIDSKDEDKVLRILGQIEMAYELGRLTWSQQDDLTDMLVYALGKWRAERGEDRQIHESQSGVLYTFETDDGGNH